MILPQFDPPGHTATDPFWEALDRGRLELPVCSVCGRWQWYPEPSGTDCANGVLEWAPVSSTGIVYSFTVVHRSFLPGGREQVPYVVGAIDLDGVVGARLMANLADDVEWEVGDRVALQVGTIEGRTHPVFVPEDVVP